MKLTKKKLLITICVLLVLCVTGFAIIRTVIISQREATAIMEQEREIRIAYEQVNYAFLLVEDRRMVRFFDREEGELEGEFRTLPEVDPEVNPFGILAPVYILLIMYEEATGDVLTYDTVLDYFSQKYEEDGSLRLHNNGKHPEIHSFVEWMWEEYRWWEEFPSFISKIRSAHLRYDRANQDSEIEGLLIHNMSPQVLRKLVRAANDPEYLEQMDLTGLQQVGY
jgi:hypothetical protein